MRSTCITSENGKDPVHRENDHRSDLWIIEGFLNSLFKPFFDVLILKKSKHH
jgi:hypothetical protein